MRPEKKAQEKIRTGFGEFMAGIIEFFVRLIDLRPGLDRWGTISRIRDNKEMKGANAWLLMCSIMVASVGLDLDSQAVIIGAMLISPLMSPILGIGLAIGINDRQMLSISLKHFGIAICIALVTSFLYFYFTPLGSFTEQIEARTAPTFLDVLIAFFGGIAGIVSGSRKDQSNAIPGVAIATALMPPLCVTGFGLANGDAEIALKSFYLFFLNSVFVAFATYLVVQILRFPNKEFVDAKARKRTQLVLTVVSILLLIPSIMILTDVVSKARTQRLVRTYMDSNFSHAIWDFEDRPNADADSLGVILFLPAQVDGDSLETIKKEFINLDCQANLKVVQTELTREEFDREEFKSRLQKDILKLVNAEKTILDEKDKKILQLQRQLDSIKLTIDDQEAISYEAKALFPDLEAFAFAEARQTGFDSTFIDIPTFILKWSNKTKSSQKRSATIKLKNWIMVRTDVDTLQIISR